MSNLYNIGFMAGFKGPVLQISQVSLGCAFTFHSLTAQFVSPSPGGKPRWFAHQEGSLGIEW